MKAILKAEFRVISGAIEGGYFRIAVWNGTKLADEYIEASRVKAWYKFHEKYKPAKD